MKHTQRILVVLVILSYFLVQIAYTQSPRCDNVEFVLVNSYLATVWRKVHHDGANQYVLHRYVISNYNAFKGNSINILYTSIPRQPVTMSVPYLWGQRNTTVFFADDSESHFSGISPRYSIRFYTCSINDRKLSLLETSISSISLEPLNNEISEGLARDEDPSNYNIVMMEESIELWSHRGTRLVRWVYNYKKNDSEKWNKKGEYTLNTDDKFSVIPWREGLIIGNHGEIFQITKGKIKPMASSLPEQLKKKRLVLVGVQEKKKHIAFCWDGEVAKPLDVQDKDKNNIEPFLQANDVDVKITKAVTVMMLQRNKDEKEVEKLKIKQKAKRKAKLAEEAKKPKPQTLQQRLQQN